MLPSMQSSHNHEGKKHTSVEMKALQLAMLLTQFDHMYVTCHYKENN